MTFAPEGAVVMIPLRVMVSVHAWVTTVVQLVKHVCLTIMERIVIKVRLKRSQVANLSYFLL